MLDINFSSPPDALTQILEWLEENIDLQHIASVEERHVNALKWQIVDHPPVTYLGSVPPPLNVYPYEEVFTDHIKMLVNELIGPYAALGSTPSVVNSVINKDDFPLQIRAFYGLGLMASLFGAESVVTTDNFPWVRPLGKNKTQQLVNKGIPDLITGLTPQVLDTMQFYQEAFDIAAQLWGSDIFTAFFDCPDFLEELLALIAETYIQACRLFAEVSTETIEEGFIALHYTICSGHCLIKDDSSVMLSPQTYTRFIRPVNEKILSTLGGGGIHFCGSGNQWRNEFVETRGLLGVDFGQLYLNDLPAWAELLHTRKIPIVNSDWTYVEFNNSKPERLFPTGASFSVSIDNPNIIKEHTNR